MNSLQANHNSQYILFSIRPLFSISSRFITRSEVVRIILDEAHSSFLSESYRPTMQALRHLNLATVPKVFLTATLVPAHELVLADWVGISLSQTLVLRSPTTRPNHHLQVATLPPHTGDVFATTLRLASLLLETWEDPSIRGIIFVRSITALEDFASSATFPLYTYHGRMTDEDKDSNLSQWNSSTSPAKWMVATTALLHGVDYPRVDAVLFSESPYDLYDVVQGAGRAGRAGQKSLVAIVHKPPFPTQFNFNRYACQDGVRAMLDPSTCRRAAISQVMDGRRITCADLPGSPPCDVCQGCLDPIITNAIANSPPPAPTPTPSNPVRRSPPPPLYTTLFRGFSAQGESSSRTQHAKQAKDLIAKFSGCFSCRIKPQHLPCHDSCERSGVSSCSISPHLPFSCTSLPHRLGWIAFRKQLIHPSDTRRCYFCYLPDATLTTGQHKSDLPTGVKCRYADAPITAAWHVLSTPELLRAIQLDLGFIPNHDIAQSFSLWLMSYRSETEDLNLFSLFSWLCKRYYPAAFV
jgi:hypothetical protein